MYTVDDRDRVMVSTIGPPQSTGASMPTVLATDSHLYLLYEIAPAGEEVALLTFVLPMAHYFGPPNDEALHGHPLNSRGLQHYGIFEIADSSWVRSLEQMNRVHVQHNAALFEQLRHFAFTFHDTTFECIVQAVSDVTTLPNKAESKRRALMRIAFQ